MNRTGRSESAIGLGGGEQATENSMVDREGVETRVTRRLFTGRARERVPGMKGSVVDAFRRGR